MIRRYKPEDFKQIEQWLIDRGMKVFHPRVLPETGFIVDDIAAIFLFKTDSDSCYIENLVSNPHSDQAERDECIKQLLDTVLQEATRIGFKFAMAVTDSRPVITRALSHGAEIEPNKVLLTKRLR